MRRAETAREVWIPAIKQAHRDRADGKRTPAQVLGWVHGRFVPIPTLSQLFELLYGKRTIDPSGYIRYQRWRLYGDEGFVGERASVWLIKEQPTITYDGEPVAQCAVTCAPDGRRFQDFTEMRPFAPHPQSRMPQLRLFDEDTMREIEWRNSAYRHMPLGTRRALAAVEQRPHRTQEANRRWHMKKTVDLAAAQARLETGCAHQPVPASSPWRWSLPPRQTASLLFRREHLARTLSVAWDYGARTG